MDYSAPSKTLPLLQLLLLVTCLSLPVAFSQGRSRLWSLPPAHSPIEDHNGRQPAPVHPPVHSSSHHHHHHHHGHIHAPSHGRGPPAVHPPIHPPSHHHDHGHAPSHAPVHPPAPSPAPPPVNPWAELVIGRVEGVVFCKSCAYAGVNTIYGAKPISGAVVKLACNDAKNDRTLGTGKTDNDGFFSIEVAGIDMLSEVFPTCKVYLVSSPLPTCSLPSNLNGGITGGTMKSLTAPIMDLETFYYRVGPIAFEPTCEH